MLIDYDQLMNLPRGLVVVKVCNQSVRISRLPDKLHQQLSADDLTAFELRVWDRCSYIVPVEYAAHAFDTRLR